MMKKGSKKAKVKTVREAYLAGQIHITREGKILRKLPAKLSK